MDPVFHLKEYAALSSTLTPCESRYWITLGITGPIDAVQLVTVRELVRPFVHLGAPVEHDLFLLKQGEPLHRACTKVGGIPFWSANRQWPTGSDREALPFLVQFNLTASRDILPEVPGDILLVFGHPDLHSGVAIQWMSVSDVDCLIDFEHAPDSGIPTFHGFRWRCSSYPEGEPVLDEQWSGIEIGDNQEVLQPYNVFCPLGLQIGPNPALPPDPIGLDTGDRILCSFAGIRPMPGRPFPFIDHAAPLAEDELDSYSLVIGEYSPEVINCGQIVVVKKESGDFITKLVYL